MDERAETTAETERIRIARGEDDRIAGPGRGVVPGIGIVVAGRIPGTGTAVDVEGTGIGTEGETAGTTGETVGE